MATKLGIAQNTYSRYETDNSKKIPEDILEKVADLLGVSMQDIKSPTPIIMNFNNGNYSSEHGGNNGIVDPQVLKMLEDQIRIKDHQLESKDNQLKAKDQQVDFLMSLLRK